MPYARGSLMPLPSPPPREERFARTVRQSPFEALRIIAMLAIVGAHFSSLSQNTASFSFEHQPFDLKKFMMQSLFAPAGQLGVTLLFMIYSWFLCLEHVSLKRASRKAWLLERQVLCYSICLFAITTLTTKQASFSLMLSSLFPSSTNLWWYVTSYLQFLFLWPFLTQGLRALSKRNHAMLIVLSLAFFSIQPVILGYALDTLPGITRFVVIYIIIAFIRWYRPRFILSKKCSYAMLAFGVTLNLLSVYVMDIIGEFLNEPVTGGRIASIPLSPITLSIALGLLLICSRMHFTSRVVNVLSSGTFAVYLIHVYPSVRQLLWERLFPVGEWYRSPWLFPYAFGVIIFITLLGIFIDILIRQPLFAITIDRHKGRLFNRLFDLVQTWQVRLSERLSRNSNPEGPKE
jgi:hypothetical protein